MTTNGAKNYLEVGAVKLELLVRIYNLLVDVGISVITFDAIESILSNW